MTPDPSRKRIELDLYDETGLPKGPVVEKWGNRCARGAAYALTGAPVASGTKAVVRKISTGRKKYRGMASDGLERPLQF